ncbi:hypothetical protein [Hydrocarboniphaga effusa]|uniref:hypothetical protein n=1 Tax=Hydrocarboniphaga effusa TaxID=243629 RepID=UPI00398BCDC5
MQTIRQQRALGKLPRKPDMTLQRAPLPPIYDSGFARKVRNFVIAALLSLAFVSVSAATAYCCITFGI